MLPTNGHARLVCNKTATGYNNSLENKLFNWSLNCHWSRLAIRKPRSYRKYPSKTIMSYFLPVHNDKQNICFQVLKSILHAGSLQRRIHKNVHLLYSNSEDYKISGEKWFIVPEIMVVCKFQVANQFVRR